MAALTISENDGTVSYTIGGTPSSGPFVIDFPYFFVTEIVVSKIASGVSTTLTVTTDYTLTGTAADDGFSAGSVSLVSALSNCQIVITRVLSTSKATNFPTSGPLSIRSMNTLFSRMFSWVQDLKRLYGLTVRFPAGEEALASQLPPAATRALKYLGFDSLGVPTAMSGSSTTPTSAAMAPVVAAATLAAGRTALGVPSNAEAILQSIIDVEGDLIIGTAADAAARLARGTAGQSLGITSNRPAWKTPQVRSHLSGLILSTAGSSATFSIAAGMAADSTNAAMMYLASVYTKTTSAWALGTAAGSLDTGAIANSTWYHVHLIQRVDTGVVDVLLSLSATAPTMPAGYTLFRRIGSMQTNGSAQWVKFNQHGDRFDRLEVLDYTVSGTFAATLRTLSVPTGVIVRPRLSLYVQGVNNLTSIIQVAPAADATLLATAAYAYEGSAIAGSSNLSHCEGPPTNTSGQIYFAVPGYVSTTTISSSGWIDRRGQDA